MKLKRWIAAAALALAAAMPAQAMENYVIDTKGQHAFIQFKVKHLGYSWLLGSFNTFSGSFTYDEAKPAGNSATVNIDVNSVFTNHAERDKHLRSADFFDVADYPTASFVSTGYEDKGNGNGVLKGKLTLRGVTKQIAIDVHQTGTGNDPWGGYRRGFEGTTTLHLSDYNMPYAAKLGPAVENIELYLSVEGIRQ